MIAQRHKGHWIAHSHYVTKSNNGVMCNVMKRFYSAGALSRFI